MPDPSRRVRRNPDACTSSPDQTLIHANSKTPARERLIYTLRHTHIHTLAASASKPSVQPSRDPGFHKNRFLPVRLRDKNNDSDQNSCLHDVLKPTNFLKKQIRGPRLNHSSLYLLLCSFACTFLLFRIVFISPDCKCIYVPFTPAGVYGVH